MQNSNQAATSFDAIANDESKPAYVTQMNADGLSVVASADDEYNAVQPGLILISQSYSIFFFSSSPTNFPFTNDVIHTITVACCRSQSMQNLSSFIQCFLIAGVNNIYKGSRSLVLLCMFMIIMRMINQEATIE